jgi:hypothetical protein
MLPKLNNFYHEGKFFCPESWQLLKSKIGGNCFVVKKDNFFFMYNFCTCFWSEVVENWAGGYVETDTKWFEAFTFAKTYSHNYFPKNENNGDTTAWKIVSFAEPRLLPKIIN